MKRLLLFLLLFIQLGFVQTFPDDWGKYIPITIESDDVSATLTDWVFVFDQDFDAVLTSVDGPLDLDGAAPAKNGGGDIRFTSDEAGTTELSVDVRVCIPDNTPANGVLVVAVNVTSVSSTIDEVVYLWYNSPTATLPAVGATYGQYNTYRTSIEGVWTLDNDPNNDAAGAILDRTSNQHHGTTTDMTSANIVNAPVGNGLSFDGLTEEIAFGDNVEHTFGNGTADEAFSIEYSYLSTDATATRIAYSKTNDYNTGEYYGGTSSSGNLVVRSVDASASAYIGRLESSSHTTGSWYHVVFTADDSELSTGMGIYWNGVLQSDGSSSSGTYVAMENTAYEFIIGDRGNSSNNWEGNLSGFTMYREELTTAEISANYKNSINFSGFITFGSITDNDPPPPNNPSFRPRRSYGVVKIIGGLKVGSASSGFIDSVKAVADSLYIYFQDDVYGIPGR